MELDHLDRFSQKSEILNFIKIRPLRVVLFHLDRRTDMKLTVAFRSIANAPKNCTTLVINKIRQFKRKS